MTQDELKEMAKKVYGDTNWTEASLSRLEEFAALVAAKEREECAKVCETLWDTAGNGMATEDAAYGNECATAIKARGQR